MRDISKYTPNAQKIIRLGWEACEAGLRGDKKEFRHILDKREKFCDENFTLEDYDSMLEESSDYPPEHNMWKRAKEEYLAFYLSSLIFLNICS